MAYLVEQSAHVFLIVNIQWYVTNLAKPFGLAVNTKQLQHCYL